jgi:hypothetical protein
LNAYVSIAVSTRRIITDYHLRHAWYWHAKRTRLTLNLLCPSQAEEQDSKNTTSNRIQQLIRPAKKKWKCLCISTGILYSGMIFVSEAFLCGRMGRICRYAVPLAARKAVSDGFPLQTFTEGDALEP